MAEILPLLAGGGAVTILGFVIMALLTHLRSVQKPATDTIAYYKTLANQAEEKAEAMRRLLWAAEDHVRQLEAENRSLALRVAALEVSGLPPNPTGGPI